MALTPPHRQHTTTQPSGLPHPGEYLRLCPLQHKRCTETKKYGPNERTGQNSRKKLSNKEIANQSNAEFKTLVIKMLTEMTEYSRKIKEEMMAIQSEMKKNIQGTNSKGKETGT